MPSTSPLAEAVALRGRLAGIRRRARFLVVLRGSGLLLLVAAICLVTAGLLDWRWHLPGVLRALTLAALLTTSGWLFCARLWRPLAAPADDLTLALQIEDA